MADQSIGTVKVAPFDFVESCVRPIQLVRWVINCQTIWGFYVMGNDLLDLPPRQE